MRASNEIPPHRNFLFKGLASEKDEFGPDCGKFSSRPRGQIYFCPRSTQTPADRHSDQRRVQCRGSDRGEPSRAIRREDLFDCALKALNGQLTVCSPACGWEASFEDQLQSAW